MAIQTLMVMLDDLDGSPADGIQTVVFGLDGFEYEIDLDPDNAAMLREMIAPYAPVARRASRGTDTRTRRRRVSAVAIRAWARAKRIPVAKRGCIPREIQRRYEAERSSIIGPGGDVRSARSVDGQAAGNGTLTAGSRTQSLTLCQDLAAGSAKP